MVQALEIMRLGERYDRAIQHLKTACNLLPQVPRYHYILGNAYYTLEEFATAQSKYSEAINLKDDDPQCYISRALCWRKLGKLEDALSDANRACELDSQNGL